MRLLQGMHAQRTHAREWKTFNHCIVAEEGLLVPGTLSAIRKNTRFFSDDQIHGHDQKARRDNYKACAEWK